MNNLKDEFEELYMKLTEIPLYDSVAIIVGEEVIKGLFVFQTKYAIYITSWKMVKKLDLNSAVWHLGEIQVLPSRIVLIEKYIFRNSDKTKGENEKIIAENDRERKMHKQKLIAIYGAV